jgi:hypothetical protein
MQIALKLRGIRQIDAAEWMLGKPTPEEVDEEGREWEQLGVTLRDGILSIPAHLLADFIEECEDGIAIFEHHMDDPYDGPDIRAFIRAMTTLIEKLEGLK